MNSKKYFICAGISCLLAAVLTIILKTTDLAAIGPEGTSIGLSSMNSAIHSAIGVHESFYTITQYLGYLSLVNVPVFALIGLIQLIRRKSLLKVDYEILCLGGVYLVTLLLYILFEKVVVNYRPIIMAGEEHVEASFPSSHTMLAVVGFGATLIIMGRYIKNKSIFTVVKMLYLLAIVVMVSLRFLSGVHWFTDIIAGLLISLTLLFAYLGVLRLKK